MFEAAFVVNPKVTTDGPIGLWLDNCSALMESPTWRIHAPRYSFNEIFAPTIVVSRNTVLIADCVTFVNVQLQVSMTIGQTITDIVYNFAMYQTPLKRTMDFDSFDGSLCKGSAKLFVPPPLLPFDLWNGRWRSVSPTTIWFSMIAMVVGNSS